ncbi:hypothetical protein QLX08_004385 [Tetragonisca angustula]|uniref:Uncharacterized protein n=1 Tax=Tetragonisca angustula TaxID=166442 RepID=A0AAW1A2W9_9HYME
MSLDNAIMPQLASDRMVAAVAEHVRQGFRLIPASLVPQEALLSGRQTIVHACPARQSIGQHSGKQFHNDITHRNGLPVFFAAALSAQSGSPSTHEGCTPGENKHSTLRLTLRPQQRELCTNHC